MSDTNCLIQKPRCGLQTGSTVCTKCGLDTRVGGYTSQQEGEAARHKAVAAWDLADKKEQTELANVSKALPQTPKQEEQPSPPDQPQPEPAKPPEQPATPLKSKSGIGVLALAVIVLTGGFGIWRYQENKVQKAFLDGISNGLSVQRELERNKVAASSAAAVSTHNLSSCTDCPEMVVVPAGSFHMGGSDSEAFSIEKPVHPVNVKSFAIGKYEVTQGQWRAIMGSNPSKFTQCGENCPVDNVSWNDIQTYIQKLNQKTGQRYRLPTEAEWEYACRGGRQQKYCGSDNVGSVAWYDDNSANTTHPVGQKAPNAFGLYDINGNVWEWVQDRNNKSYDGAPADGTAWEAGSTERVLRGGSWRSGARFTRAAYRLNKSPDDRDFSSGFRLARTVP